MVNNDDVRDAIISASTKSTITDEFDNVTSEYYIETTQFTGLGIDITSKKFIVTLEFADNPEIGNVTIEITLP